MQYNYQKKKPKQKTNSAKIVITFNEHRVPFRINRKVFFNKYLVLKKLLIWLKNFCFRKL